ncbi:hypothetical protein OE810_13230 [Rhodobacteraceae bacterium XHP0102]|nr:hypothetical protein [Rhodobacteraceae bacterium XHP0102]
MSGLRRDYMTMLKEGYQKRDKAKPMWKEHPIKVAQDHSAIVAENEYGVLIDLTLCADAMWNNLREPEIHNGRNYYDGQRYRYMVWSDLERYLVGVVEEQDNGLELTLMGYGFKEMVTLKNVIEIAVKSHEQWSRSSLDP